MTKQLLSAIFVLTGTIIGVGFFALPYLTAQVGLPVMLFYFIVVGGLIALVHWCFGEVALNTPDFLRLPGYSERYFGKLGKGLAFWISIVGSYGSILAYLVIGGRFLHNILGNILGSGDFIYCIIYFLFGAILVALGTNSVRNISGVDILILLFFILYLTFFGKPYFSIGNLLTVSPSWNNIFLPYGPILFSLWGATMIPEIEEMLGENKRYLKKAVVLGVIISIIFYLVFSILVSGITGQNTSDDAISGLKAIFGSQLVFIGSLMGLITTFTSFVAIALTQRKIFNYDLRLKKGISLILVFVVPLVLFVIGFQDFIGIISFFGGVAMGLEGILIMMMYYKVSKRIWLTLPLTLIFLVGMVYEIIMVLR
ncbi:MAG: aromatic amino acid transport family protein [bacterium]